MDEEERRRRLRSLATPRLTTKYSLGAEAAERPAPHPDPTLNADGLYLFLGSRCCRPLPFQKHLVGALWGLFWNVVGSSPTPGIPCQRATALGECRETEVSDESGTAD